MYHRYWALITPICNNGLVYSKLKIAKSLDNILDDTKNI